jgi:hypothetical protein
MAVKMATEHRHQCQTDALRTHLNEMISFSTVIPISNYQVLVARDEVAAQDKPDHLQAAGWFLAAPTQVVLYKTASRLYSSYDLGNSYCSIFALESHLFEHHVLGLGPGRNLKTRP